MASRTTDAAAELQQMHHRCQGKLGGEILRCLGAAEVELVSAHKISVPQPGRILSHRGCRGQKCLFQVAVSIMRRHILVGIH